MSESTATGTEPVPAPVTPPEADQSPPAPSEPAAGEPAGDSAVTGQAADLAATATEPAAGDSGQSSGSPRRRRVLRAVGRWTAAAAAFGILGTGIVYGITEQERTDLPGLATTSDGRWDYPELVLPALPAGSPRPFAEGNEGEIHHADVRDLLLPVPAGAAEGKGLPGIGGEWLSKAEFAEVYSKGDRADLRQELTDDAVRHIAARGWVMPDGTRTGIYLLQFNSGAYPGDFLADAVVGGVTPYVSVTGSREDEVDESWPDDTFVPYVERTAFDEVKPRGERHVRSAYLTAGDTLAVIVQSREGTAPAVPFQQTVILQSQLLG